MKWNDEANFGSLIFTRGGTSMVVFEIWKSGCYRDGKAPKCITFSKCWWLSNDFEITPKPYVFVFGSQTQTMVSCEHFHATKNRLRQTNCEENLLSKQIFASIKRNMTISLREKITFEKKKIGAILAINVKYFSYSIILVSTWQKEGN